MKARRAMGSPLVLILAAWSCVGSVPRTLEPAPDPDTEVVGHWSLDDPRDAEDAIGGLPAALPTGLTSTSGVRESAYDFEGTGAVTVDVGAGFDFDDGFSATAWVKVPFASGQDQVRRDVVGQWVVTPDAFGAKCRTVDIASQTIIGGQGYWGATFDGRYMNMMAYGENPPAYSRFDTWGVADNLADWEHQTPDSLFGPLASVLVGYINTGFDGRFVYYSPYNNGAWFSTVLRYDTSLPREDAASWSYYDIADGGVIVDPGAFGTEFDGRHLYLRPNTGNRLPRYDTWAELTTPEAWSSFERDSKPGFMAPESFYGSTVLRKRLFWPAQPTFSFDLEGDYTSADAWTRVGSDPADGVVGTTDGLIVLRDADCVLERYASLDEFTPAELSAPTETFNPCAAFSDVLARFYVGFFDGRYVTVFGYSGPGANYGSPRASYRYDTTLPFTEPSSWERFDPNGLPSSDLVGGFTGASFDGRFIYAWPARITEDECGGGCDRGARDILVCDTLGTEESWRLSVSESGFNGSGGHPLGPAATIVTNDDGVTQSFSVYANQRLEADTWYHLALTYDGEELALFIDGLEVARRAATGTLRAPSSPLTIGGMTGGTAMHRGAVDEVRLHRGALSAAKVKAELCGDAADKPICASR